MLSIGRALRAHPTAPRETILRFRDERLRRLILHAARNVPFYRRRFERFGIRPEEIRGAADLAKIPPVSREEIQGTDPKDLVSRGIDPDRLVVFETGGSTGTPLRIRRTWIEERILAAFRLRTFRLYGFRLRDRRVVIRALSSYHANDPGWIWEIVHGLGLLRDRAIDCGLPPEEIIANLRREPPDVIGGYPSILARTAEFVTDADRTVIRPRFIASGSEVLTPSMRRTIREGFGAPVYSLYGCREANVLAWECPETGAMHVCDDNVVLEIVRDGRPVGEGERGEVLITPLHSLAMPFVRYRLSDVVTKGSETCSCGMPFPTLRGIQGRMIDFFPLPDGRLLHPYGFSGPLKRAAPWIRMHQATQVRRDHVILRLVPKGRPSSDEIAAAHAAVAEALGPAVRLEVEIVDSIDWEKNGKFRVWRSLVSSQYDDLDWNRVPK